MIPPTHQAKKIPGRQQGQGHEVVLHDQGEGYQQISESHILVRNRSNTIPWA